MKIYLKSDHGQYMRASLPSGHEHGVMNQAVAPGPWEEFEQVNLGDGKVAFRTAHGMYVRAWAPGTRPDADTGSAHNGVLDQADALDVWEKFERVGNAYRTHHGEWVRASQPDGHEQGIVNQSPAPYAWETWTTEHMPGSGNGLRHDDTTLSLPQFYPASSFLAACWIGGSSDQRLLDYLATPEVQAANCVKITACQGARANINAVAFDGRRELDALRRKLQIIIDHDKAPLLHVLTQSYWDQVLGKSANAAIDTVREVTQTTADLFLVVCDMWEKGEALDGNHMAERRRMAEAMRIGCENGGHPDRRIAEHERSDEDIPQADLEHLGPCAFLLQTSFTRPVQGVPVKSGNHSFPSTVAFVQNSVERSQRPAFEGQCVVYADEHSISVPGWGTVHTLGEAYERGRVLVVEGGATGELSGGYQRGA